MSTPRIDNPGSPIRLNNQDEQQEQIKRAQHLAELARISQTVTDRADDHRALHAEKRSTKDSFQANIKNEFTQNTKSEETAVQTLQERFFDVEDVMKSFAHNFQCQLSPQKCLQMNNRLTNDAQGLKLIETLKIALDEGLRSAADKKQEPQPQTTPSAAPQSTLEKSLKETDAKTTLAQELETDKAEAPPSEAHTEEASKEPKTQDQEAAAQTLKEDKQSKEAPTTKVQTSEGAMHAQQDNDAESALAQFEALKQQPITFPAQSAIASLSETENHASLGLQAYLQKTEPANVPEMAMIILCNAMADTSNDMKAVVDKLKMQNKLNQAMREQITRLGTIRSSMKGDEKRYFERFKFDISYDDKSGNFFISTTLDTQPATGAYQDVNWSTCNISPEDDFKAKHGDLGWEEAQQNGSLKQVDGEHVVGDTSIVYGDCDVLDAQMQILKSARDAEKMNVNKLTTMMHQVMDQRKNMVEQYGKIMKSRSDAMDLSIANLAV